MQVQQLIAELERAPSDALVRFDFCGAYPTRIRSWRGIYAEPALGWEVDGQYPNVASVIAAIKEGTNGCYHQGWKGGAYKFQGSDQLHIDNAGEWTSTEIDRVTVDNAMVVIHTKYED